MKYTNQLSPKNFKAILEQAGLTLNEEYCDNDIGFQNGVFYGDNNVILSAKLENGKNVFVGVTDYSIKLAKKGNSITWIDTDLTAAFMDYMSLKFGKQYDQDFNNYYNIKIEL